MLIHYSPLSEFALSQPSGPQTLGLVAARVQRFEAGMTLNSSPVSPGSPSHTSCSSDLPGQTKQRNKVLMSCQMHASVSSLLEHFNL